MNNSPASARGASAYTTYRWLKSEDFTAFGHHYGGNILKWAEEESGIYAARQLGTFQLATVGIANIGFPTPLEKQEDILRLDIRSVMFGATSLRFSVAVSAARTGANILTIGQITFVNLSEEGTSRPHGFTVSTDTDERLLASSSRTLTFD